MASCNFLTSFQENDRVLSRFSKVYQLCTGSEVNSVQQQDENFQIFSCPDWKGLRGRPSNGVTRACLIWLHFQRTSTTEQQQSGPKPLDSSLPCPTSEWMAHQDNAHTGLGQLRSTHICYLCKYRWATHLCGVLSFRWLWQLIGSKMKHVSHGICIL